MTQRRLRRWRWAAPIGLGLVGLGLLTTTPGLLLGGAVGLAAAGFARAGTAPRPTLTVERSLDPPSPDPNERVEVTVTVRNDGEAFCSDLRLGDSIPPGVRVVEGSSQHATALRPGDGTTFSYVVEAAIGTHEIGPLSVITRDHSGTAERSTTAGGTSSLRVEPARQRSLPIPLREATTPYVGRLPIDEGGSGIEFHSVREYRTGDPLKRIDWAQLARTGDLATRDFRVERAASVVVVVDTRGATRVADADGRPTFGRSLDAASAISAGLLDRGHRVGLAAFGPVHTWIGPGADRLQQRRIDGALASDPAFDHARPDRQFSPKIRLQWLQVRIPTDAQLVIVSPLVDDEGAQLLRHLATLYPTTILSPDPAPGDEGLDDETGPGARIERVRRRARIDAVRSVGVPVLDWGADEPLSLAVARARRWSG